MRKVDIALYTNSTCHHSWPVLWRHPHSGMSCRSHHSMSDHVCRECPCTHRTLHTQASICPSVCVLRACCCILHMQLIALFLHCLEVSVKCITRVLHGCDCHCTTYLKFRGLHQGNWVLCVHTCTHKHTYNTHTHKHTHTCTHTHSCRLLFKYSSVKPDILLMPLHYFFSYTSPVKQG